MAVLLQEWTGGTWNDVTSDGSYSDGACGDDVANNVYTKLRVVTEAGEQFPGLYYVKLTGQSPGDFRLSYTNVDNPAIAAGAALPISNITPSGVEFWMKRTRNSRAKIELLQDGIIPYSGGGANDVGFVTDAGVATDANTGEVGPQKTFAIADAGVSTDSSYIEKIQIVDITVLDESVGNTDSITINKMLAKPVLGTPTVDSSTAITVSWTDITGEDGYTIEKVKSATDPGTGDWSGLTQYSYASKSAGATSHQFTGLDASSKYYFRIKAEGSGSYVDSDWSSSANATTSSGSSTLSADDWYPRTVDGGSTAATPGLSTDPNTGTWHGLSVYVKEGTETAPSEVVSVQWRWCLGATNTGSWLTGTTGTVPANADGVQYRLMVDSTEVGVTPKYRVDSGVFAENSFTHDLPDAGWASEYWQDELGSGYSWYAEAQIRTGGVDRAKLTVS